jgi:hypothetical protein
MRLSDFKSVDFPQPEGPMKAVISFSAIGIVNSAEIHRGFYRSIKATTTERVIL